MDPVTAVIAAETAFAGICAFVNAGRQLEDAAELLSKWFGAVTDFRRAEQEVKNPPMFKKLLFPGSVEEEAMAILMNKKKIEQQERELRNLISGRYGPQAWMELIELRRKIKKEREETLYRQQERRKKFIEGFLLIVLIVLLVTLLGGVSWFLFTYA